MCTLTRNECPCSRAHLCPGSTFGNRWAASKVNSLKISTGSLGLVHLGRPIGIIGPTRYTERPIGRVGWIILRTPEGPGPLGRVPDLRNSARRVEDSSLRTLGILQPDFTGLSRSTDRFTCGHRFELRRIDSARHGESEPRLRIGQTFTGFAHPALRSTSNAGLSHTVFRAVCAHAGNVAQHQPAQSRWTHPRSAGQAVVGIFLFALPEDDVVRKASSSLNRRGRARAPPPRCGRRRCRPTP